VRVFAVAVVAVVLGACTGAPQFAPQTGVIAPAVSSVSAAREPIAMRCPRKRGLVFASDNTTMALYVYCGPGPKPGVVAPGAKPLRTLAGVAGWGLAVEPRGNRLAVGQFGGTIAIYALPALGKPLATLKLQHAVSGYVPYGLSWDAAGGLYATEWPSSYVDYWANPLTAHAPGCVYTMPSMSEAYNVAASGSNSVDVYGVNGFSSNEPVILANVSGLATANCPSQQVQETQVATLGSLAQGTGFPGGIATDAKGELLAGNQMGFLYDMGPFPGAATPKATCTWSAPANDYTDVVLDARQSGIWVSNVNFGASLASDLVDVAYPLPANGPCVTPGPSGGPTGSVTNDEFLSVAAWKNAGQ
jgi:hypothetical protein